MILQAVKLNVWAFTRASDELRNDREFVSQAVKLNGLVLRYLDRELMDREMVFHAVKKYAYVLSFARHFKNDREVVLKQLNIMEWLSNTHLMN